MPHTTLALVSLLCLAATALARDPQGIARGSPLGAADDSPSLLNEQSSTGDDRRSLRGGLNSDPKTVVAKDIENGSTVRRSFTSLPTAKIDHIVDAWTMTIPYHRSFARDAVSRINENGIEGDIVECGVWMGGMTMLMVFENMRHDISRHFWLFDTFEGLPPPSEEDDSRAHAIYNQLQKGEKTKGVLQRIKWGVILDNKWNYGPLDVVKNNLIYTGYPRENFHYVVGKVEDTLPVTLLPAKIAILRLDTDWYLSTKAELEYMYHRLQPGGVLIVDDYCTWGGSKNAVHEFFAEVLKIDADEISKMSPCLVYWKP